jgi:CRISPR/Cas system CMR subunit Cmr6 (Cas7 group RAMP superfamily)
LSFLIVICSKILFYQAGYNEFVLSEYYSANEAPTDWQNLNPIKFLTVENTSFNFALALNKKETGRNRNKIGLAVDLRDVHKKVNNYLLSMEKLAVHQFIMEKYITSFTFTDLKL